MDRVGLAGQRPWVHDLVDGEEPWTITERLWTMGYLDLAKDDVDAELACTVDDALLGFYCERYRAGDGCRVAC